MQRLATIATIASVAALLSGCGPSAEPGSDAFYRMVEERGAPTARCKDGEWSYAETREGACDDHGGVDYWTDDLQDDETGE